MALDTQAMSTFPPATLSDDLQVVGIQNGQDVLASGQALLAQVNRAQATVDIRTFGAKVDGKFVNAGFGINSGTTTLNAPSGTFTNTATDAGKLVFIAGAGSSGGPLLTSIVTVNSSSQAIVTNAAGTTVTNKNGFFGTDDWSSWMNAINYAIYVAGNATVLMPRGISITSQTIYAGYGESTSLHTLNIVGCAPVRGSQAVYSSSFSQIFGMFHDRPIIAVQGLWSSSIENLLLRGLNWEYVFDNHLGTAIITGAIDDTNMTNWLDSHLTTDVRYRTYCGIAVDPYSGSRQSPSYPDVVYDATYYPGATQYVKNASFNVIIKNCMMTGFATGVAIGVCNSTATQLVSMDTVTISFSKWGVSHSGVELVMDNMTFSLCGTALVNDFHGTQSGYIRSLNRGWQVSNCINLWELGQAAAPCEFNDVTASVWALGSITPNSVSPSTGAITLSNFLIDFSLQMPMRGLAGRTLKETTNQAGHIIFRNGQFTITSGLSLFYFDAMPEALVFDNVTVVGPTRSLAFQQFAANAICSGIVTRGVDCPSPSSARGERKFRWAPYNLNTATVNAYPEVMLDGNEFLNFVNRPYCIPTYCDQVGNPAGFRNSMMPMPPGVLRVAKSDASITAKSLTGLLLVFNMNPATAQMFVGGINGPGLQPGDLIVDGVTGTVWFVRSVAGSTGAWVVVAEQQNNYKTTDGGFSYTNPETISLTTGDYFYFVNSRLYTTTYAMFCTMASASANLTACGTSDGVNTFMTTDLVNGDYVYMDPKQDYWANSAVAMILSAVANGSFTVGTAANAAATKKRVPYFVRPGPANALGTLTLTGPWTVTAGVHNVAFSSYVGISGGQPTYNTPTVASGALPTGITLSISGSKLIASGTTTQTGTFNGTVTVKDSQAAPATSNALAFSFTFT